MIVSLVIFIFLFCNFCHCHLKMNTAKILCIKFDFGVPLEDIFPPNDIHPNLQNLFDQTRVALKNSDLPLGTILKELDISLNEAFELKDCVCEGNLFYNEELCPSSFFWLLRHFFGLLPLPLFPCYTNRHSYKWEYLATLCRYKKLRSSFELEAGVSWLIHKLPKANVVLIYRLMNFLRKICLRGYTLKRLDLDKVKDVTIYFSSSLFFRPYRPGYVNKTDTLYYPLLHYLITNWSRIKRITNWNDELSPISENAELCSASIRVFEESRQDRFVDSSCQTSSWLLLETYKGKEEKQEEIYECPKNTGLTTSEKLEVTSVLREELKEQNETKVEFLQEDEKEEENHDFYKEIPISAKRENADDKKRSPSCVSGDYLRSNVDSPYYEEIDRKSTNTSSNSETVIYKKSGHKNITPKFIKQTMTKANISLVSVISRMKSKQEQLKSESNLKLDKHKYDLLKDSKVSKVQSLHANYGMKQSPNIKYKKLRTL